METMTEYPLYGVPEDKWFDIEATGDTVISDRELLCRNLTINGDFTLVGNLFCNDITINGDCTIYGSVLGCTNINITGNFYILENPISLRGIAQTGGFIVPRGDVQIGGDFICEYAVRASRSRFKIGGNVMSRIFDCKGISIAGDCDIYPDTLWALEPVYVLGNITTGFPIESELVFCGGKYTKMFDPNRISAVIYENFEDWNAIKEVLHE